MPIKVDELTRAASARKVIIFNLLKASAIDAPWIYFDKPVTIIEVKMVVSVVYDTTGYAAGAIEIGTAADPDAYAENTSTVSATAAANTDIPFTLNDVNIPGGTWVRFKAAASSGGGSHTVTITYKEVETE